MLCVCGLAAEARIARAAGFRAIVGGGEPRRTAALIVDAARDARCLISFGVAGGLAPRLRPGDIILSTEVVSASQYWRAGGPLASQCAAIAMRIGALTGPVFGASAVLATVAAKQRAWREAGALAVDLESMVVAQAAAARGLPFFVLRAIADPASRDLPPAALIPLAASGEPAWRRVAAELARRPGQIAQLIGLARETRRALRALADPARALRQALAGPA